MDRLGDAITELLLTLKEQLSCFEAMYLEEEGNQPAPMELPSLIEIKHTLQFINRAAMKSASAELARYTDTLIDQVNALLELEDIHIEDFQKDIDKEFASQIHNNLDANWLSPHDMGMAFNPTLSSDQVNHYLQELEMQTYTDRLWKPTDKADDFCDRKNGQLIWKASLIKKIEVLAQKQIDAPMVDYGFLAHINHVKAIAD